MATNFQSRSDVQVILGTAASSAKAVGTAHAKQVTLGTNYK